MTAPISAQASHIAVSNCAAAADGGSLWLELIQDGKTSGFGLNRAIGSRGTDQYEVISGQNGALTRVELADLLLTLGTVHQGECLGIVAEFSKVIRQKLGELGV